MRGIDTINSEAWDTATFLMRSSHNVQEPEVEDGALAASYQGTDQRSRLLILRKKLSRFGDESRARFSLTIRC
jgi:hypothetical protein